MIRNKEKYLNSKTNTMIKKSRKLNASFGGDV
jgi:hypothetical protein